MNTSLLQKQANSMLLEMLHASQIQIQNKQKTKNVKYYLLFYIDNAFLEMYPTYRAASVTWLKNISAFHKHFKIHSWLHWRVKIFW